MIMFVEWVQIKLRTVSHLWLVIFLRSSLIQEWVFMEHARRSSSSYLYQFVTEQVGQGLGALLKGHLIRVNSNIYMLFTDTGVLGPILISILGNKKSNNDI